MTNVQRKQRLARWAAKYNKSRAQQYLKMSGKSSALATKGLLHYYFLCKKKQAAPKCHSIGRIIRKAEKGLTHKQKLSSYRPKPLKPRQKVIQELAQAKLPKTGNSVSQSNQLTLNRHQPGGSLFFWPVYEPVNF